MAQQTDGCRGDLRLESLAPSRHIRSEPVADVIPSNAKESRWRRDFLRRTTEYVSPLDRMRPPTVEERSIPFQLLFPHSLARPHILFSQKFFSALGFLKQGPVS